MRPGSEHPRVGGEDPYAVRQHEELDGTPPRRRGGLLAQLEEVDRERNIPASAGRTGPTSSDGSKSPEHPRVGGEDRQGNETPRSRSEHPRVGGEERGLSLCRSVDGGTSPRRWGGRPACSGQGLPDRNTPASARRTRASTAEPGSSSEHPRVGGEGCLLPLEWLLGDGSPPLRWRRPSQRARPATPRRGTLALARKAARPRVRCTWWMEHLRVGGEDEREQAKQFAAYGAPPRRWGGPDFDSACGGGKRNTPATAGRTRGRPSSCRRTAEHPRVGGEDAPRSAAGSSGSGAPPRRRGGRPGRLDREGRGRNTPASAGRTVLVGAQASGSTGTPPRRRGGLRRLTYHDRSVRTARSTPASAGRATPLNAPKGRPPEHPRVGGEEGHVVRAPSWDCGTPPRRRGGQLGFPGNLPGDRSTPALAGRTCTTKGTEMTGAEHPRVGGEDGTVTATTNVMGGTPPRRRGGPPVPAHLHSHRRNTPASAGRTGRDRPRLLPPPEHPRVGGEDDIPAPHDGEVRGTPPRRREGHRDGPAGHRR